MVCKATAKWPPRPKVGQSVQCRQNLAGIQNSYPGSGVFGPSSQVLDRVISHGTCPVDPKFHACRSRRKSNLQCINSHRIDDAESCTTLTNHVRMFCFWVGSDRLLFIWSGWCNVDPCSEVEWPVLKDPCCEKINCRDCSWRDRHLTWQFDVLYSHDHDYNHNNDNDACHRRWKFCVVWLRLLYFASQGIFNVTLNDYFDEWSLNPM